MYDLIGDIHGHADALEALLRKLGYKNEKGAYRHPAGRKVIFVGDYIDRGPKIRETLAIVRAMTENGTATALMGNHEYNALCYHYEKPGGGHYRPHNLKNFAQHYKTLEQFIKFADEYENYLEWFLELPLYFEDKHLRAVHACWDATHITFLKSTLEKGLISKALVMQSTEKGTPLHHAIEETLKGKEHKLPPSIAFNDKDGHKRTEMRIKWWESPAGQTYRGYSVLPEKELPDTKIEWSDFPKGVPYPSDDKPVFFGHYWLQGDPVLCSSNVCCLDFSIAKGGKLAAYRFDGEKQLDEKKLVWV
jgi:5'-deoxynucleotidase YfbR-like HD superfamily hydrolase